MKREVSSGVIRTDAAFGLGWKAWARNPPNSRVNGPERRTWLRAWLDTRGLRRSIA